MNIADERLDREDELVYVADQDQDEMFELHASTVGELRRRAGAPVSR